MITPTQSHAPMRAAQHNPMLQLMKNQAATPSLETAYGDSVTLSSATERQSDSIGEAIITTGCGLALPPGAR